MHNLSGFVMHPEFAFESQNASLQEIIDELCRPFPVVRVNEIGNRGETIGQLMLGIPEHRFPPRREVHFVREQIPIPKPVV